jgi:hypothetical protein
MNCSYTSGVLPEKVSKSSEFQDITREILPHSPPPPLPRSSLLESLKDF